MVTFKEKMLEELQECGLHPYMAEEAVDLITSDASMTNMAGRWNSDTNGYPEAIFKLTWLNAKPIVAKFLAEKYPAAWFRPIFAEGMASAQDKDAFVRDFWAKENTPTNDVTAVDNFPDFIPAQTFGELITGKPTTGEDGMVISENPCAAVELPADALYLTITRSKQRDPNKGSSDYTFDPNAPFSHG